ncbi:hypothetical protein [Desulfoferula mesophila]|uniref:hypothetical protein n=1 Tax=Desulfoferula mesophila TaxID=3058419 RepID=UPI0030CCDC71
MAETLPLLGLAGAFLAWGFFRGAEAFFLPVDFADIMPFKCEIQLANLLYTMIWVRMAACWLRITIPTN